MKPYYSQDGITLYHGDCREVVPDLGGTLLVTDPPFNVGKKYKGGGDRMPPDEYEGMIRMLADRGPERQAWVTPTNRQRLFIGALGDEARPVVVRRGAQGPLRNGWFDQFDIILARGEPARRTSNLWDGIRLKGEGYYFREHDFGHPGYTPMALTARMVAVMSKPGDVVVEPFAGTGTTLVAAKVQGLQAVGSERSEAYCELIVKRLAQSVLFGGAQ